jgi:hypothetical protein
VGYRPARPARRGGPAHPTRANLALWQHAGDVLDAATATGAAHYCLDVLTDDSAFVTRTTPSFLVIPYTLDALAGLLDAADDALHRDLAGFLASLPPVTDQLEARGWARVAAGLRAPVLTTPQDRAGWRQAAGSQPDRRLAAAILGVLAHDDEVARELLLGRVADGDNDAFVALGPVGQLDTEVAERLMAQDAELLDAIIAEAQVGVHSIRTYDPAARLAILGSHFPEVTPWDALLRYLGHARVPGERKRNPCLALAHNADRLPDSVLSALRDFIPQLKPSSSPVNLFGSPFGGAAMIFAAAAVGVLDDKTLISGLTTLLTGARQERCDAATLIGRLGRPELTAALVTLVSDPYPDIRAQAAHALAMRVASSDTGIDQLAIGGLQRALADPGALVSLAIADGVATTETPSDEARTLIAPLPAHPSAVVRETARRAIRG